MAYQTRRPPVRTVVSIEKFNSLVELVSNLTEQGDDRYSKLAERMKEKLLRYSVPRTNEDGETSIDIRFFTNEAEELIHFLLAGLDIKTDTNYYEVLLKVRETKKNELYGNE